MNFEIDEAFICSVTIRKEHPRFGGRTDLTDEELIEVIKHPEVPYSISSEDHPEFTRLREQLCEDGYITIERSWWNGDRVVKPFKLNGCKFKKGDSFYCASAMSGHLKFHKKRMLG